MRAKVRERERARELRSAGWSLRRIAEELQVALSSVSVWVRDVNAGREVDSLKPRSSEGRRSLDPVPMPSPRKRCGRCRRDLPLEAFNRYREARQHWCRDCFKAYFRDRGAKHVEQSQAAKRRRQHATYRAVDAILAGSQCADCGVAERAVLEFDHVDGKTANISHLTYAAYASPRVLAEIERCEVVCVNCHRVRTARRARSWRHADPDLRSQALTPGQRRNLIWMRDLLRSSSCADCGVANFAILEFDHVGPKSENVPRLARNGVSLKRLQAEVAECEIVCGNCHRKRTRARKRRSDASK